MAMTRAYQRAQGLLKAHVHAAPDDVIITQGSGMTAVVNKLQRMLGLRLPEQLAPFCQLPDELRPLVLLTHMEHHSNQTSWLETVATVEVVPPDERGQVDVAALEELLARYHDRPLKIGAFTACSNVTGVPPRCMRSRGSCIGTAGTASWITPPPHRTWTSTCTRRIRRRSWTRSTSRRTSSWAARARRGC
jgi:hypothetical protein